jgi:hypothetical protein
VTRRVATCKVIAVPEMASRLDGPADALAILSAMGAFGASIPGAELALVKGTQHLPNIEQSEAFNTTSGDDLGRHAGFHPQGEPGREVNARRP